MTCCATLKILLVVFVVNIKLLQSYSKPWNEKYENNKCPKLYPKNFDNYMPSGKYLFSYKVKFYKIITVILKDLIINACALD